MCINWECWYAALVSVAGLLSYTLTLYSPAGRPVMLTDPLSLSCTSLCSVLLMVYWLWSSCITTIPGAVELMANVHSTSMELVCWSLDTSQSWTLYEPTVRDDYINWQLTEQNCLHLNFLLSAMIITSDAQWHQFLLDISSVLYHTRLCYCHL